MTTYTKHLPVLPLLIILACVFLAVDGYAATYYVSWTDGSDSYTDAQAQNPTTPWKSLDKVTSGPSGGFKPDDSILFKRGDTWDLSDASNSRAEGGITRLGIKIGASGTSGHPIIFSNYGSGVLPTFSCGNNASPTTCTVIYGAVRNHITIDGLNFINNLGSDNAFDNAVCIAGANGAYAGSNSWEIKNCIVTHMHNGFNLQGNGHKIHHNIINTIKHSGIYSYNSSASDGAFNEVYSNDVSNCSYNGIDIVGASNSNWDIHSNYCHENNNAIELSGTSYSNIWNNVCYNNHVIAGPYTNSGGCFILVAGASHNMVYGNTAFSNDYGYVLQTSDSILGNEFKNNISVESTVAEFYIFSDVQRKGNTFSNNLAYTSGGTRLRFTQSGTTCGGSMGMCTTTWWTANVDANPVYSDPQFVSVSSPPSGLSLQPLSPAVGVGLNLGAAYATDIVGNARPLDSS